MGKLCIVRRQRPIAERGIDRPCNLDQYKVDGPRHEQSGASKRLTLAWESPLRGNATGPEDQKPCMGPTPTQSIVVKSHADVEFLPGGKAEGSGAHRPEDEKVVFNFYFKQVYLPRMLTRKDVCTLLQVSNTFLNRLIKRGELKSYRIGRLRRFPVEDVLAHLSRSPGVGGRRGQCIVNIGA
jgi:excisionase family DNA binding protein